MSTFPEGQDFFSQFEGEEPQQQVTQPSEQYDFFSQFEDPPEQPSTKTNVLGAIGDIGKGLLNVPIDVAASVAGIIDDPYTEDGTFDRFIEWNRKRNQIGRASCRERV